jgi:hypothetical protein
MILRLTKDKEATCPSQDWADAAANRVMTSCVHATHMQAAGKEMPREWLRHEQRLSDRTKTKSHRRSHVAEAVAQPSRQRLLQASYFCYLDQMSRFLRRETEFIMHVPWTGPHNGAVYY